MLLFLGLITAGGCPLLRGPGGCPLDPLFGSGGCPLDPLFGSGGCPLDPLFGSGGCPLDPGHQFSDGVFAAHVYSLVDCKL